MIILNLNILTLRYGETHYCRLFLVRNIDLIHNIPFIIFIVKFVRDAFYAMDNYLHVKVIKNKTHKYFNNNKPYWDDELTHFWKAMALAEKEFRKYKYKKSVQIDFILRQESFVIITLSKEDTI